MRREDARAKIEELIDRYTAMSAQQRTDITEASVVTQFIEPLLKALGWEIEDPNRYAKELYTQAGRPDITLMPEQGGTIFLEAKRFGKIQELKEARKTISGVITPGQLALPGMATDRTEEEQQAINYAFKNNGTWAILTNFEKLRLFNARRDWLVVSIEKPLGYIEQFDYLWQLAYENVIGGSLDRLSSERHRADVDTDYLGFITHYRERLAQDIVEHSGANRWAYHEGDRINLPLLREVVQRFLDRMVVIRFAEDHFVLPPGTLRQQIEASMPDQYGAQYGFSPNEVVRQLFRRFDQHHNSALFSHHAVLDEAVEFSEDLITELVDKLYDARYRAMTPDIMGNTYEQYLGETLVQVNGTVEARTNLETRKKQGSYYTPQVIVQYLVDNSLGRMLYGTADGKPDGEPIEGETRKTYEEITKLRVLDPACGSGSFLIYAYTVLAGFYRAEMARVEGERTAYADKRAAEGASPLDIQLETKPFEVRLTHLKQFPRLILENHLYGVDLDPQAAELAAVNLIMQAMEDQRRQGSKRRLPLILNQNIKVGNSLIGSVTPPDEAAILYDDIGELVTLRADLKTAALRDERAREDQIAAQIAKKEAALTEQLNGPLRDYFDDAAAHRPFHWAVQFPEAFATPEGQPLEAPGFDVVVGNPPWEIVKPDLREFYAQFSDGLKDRRVSRNKVDKIVKGLNSEDPKREEAWQNFEFKAREQLGYFGNTESFSRQDQGDIATQKLFLERAWLLLNDHGFVSFVVPTGIYRDRGTRDLRTMFFDEGSFIFLYSFSNEKFFFSEVHHDFRFTLLCAQKGVDNERFWSSFRFNPRVAIAPDDLYSFLNNKSNLMQVNKNVIKRFSPDNAGLLELENPEDYRVAEVIYSDCDLLGEATWSTKFAQEFHMTNDRHLFNNSNSGWSLLEGKYIHQFEVNTSDTQFSVEIAKGKNRLQSKRTGSDWHENFRVGIRSISNATNERTSIAAIIPPHTFTGNSLWLTYNPNLSQQLYLAAIVNSFCLDWVLRLKVDKNVSRFILEELPIPYLEPGDPPFDALVPLAARLTCTTAAFADLWQSVMGSVWSPEVAATDDAERQALRDEIDARVAHLYGLSRADFAHILATFPLVFGDDEVGEAKKAALLAVYDRVGAI